MYNCLHLCGIILTIHCISIYFVDHIDNSTIHIIEIYMLTQELFGLLFRFGLVFFMILLTSCIYMWRSGYRERIIYFGTVPPSYSPLSHKEAHLQTVCSR